MLLILTLFFLLIFWRHIESIIIRLQFFTAIHSTDELFSKNKIYNSRYDLKKKIMETSKKRISFYIDEAYNSLEQLFIFQYVTTRKKLTLYVIYLCNECRKILFLPNVCLTLWKTRATKYQLRIQLYRKTRF